MAKHLDKKLLVDDAKVSDMGSEPMSDTTILGTDSTEQLETPEPMTEETKVSGFHGILVEYGENGKVISSRPMY